MTKALGYAAKHSFSRLKPLLFERNVAGQDEVDTDVLFCGVTDATRHIETQDVLEFCAEHDIAPEIEIVPFQEINNSYTKVNSEDVRFRYVIDMASLKRDFQEAAEKGLLC